MLSVETFPSNPLGLNLGSEYSYKAFINVREDRPCKGIYFRELV